MHVGDVIRFGQGSDSDFVASVEFLCERKAVFN
nr:hypothetical protein Iba_chr11eCG7430 [Ipomoea batatas]